MGRNENIGRNLWLRTHTNMSGASTFSKSPMRERQPTCKIIKPVVDESIESMHIVTLDLLGAHTHDSFAHPQNSHQQVLYPMSNPA